MTEDPHPNTGQTWIVVTAGRKRWFTLLPPPAATQHPRATPHCCSDPYGELRADSLPPRFTFPPGGLPGTAAARGHPLLMAAGWANFRCRGCPVGHAAPLRGNTSNAALMLMAGPTSATTPRCAPSGRRRRARRSACASAPRGLSPHADHRLNTAWCAGYSGMGARGRRCVQRPGELFYLPPGASDPRQFTLLVLQ
jgi:hypothetical protein